MSESNAKEDAQVASHPWDLISIEKLRKLSAFVAAPAVVIGSLAIVALFALGLVLIYRLVAISWTGSIDQSVRAASAALTAIAAVFGALFISWRTIIAHWAARAAENQATASRESHLTTLFTKAVEQLGSTRDVKRYIPALLPIKEATAYTETVPNLEVRIGAIYALERISRDSERDHWPIMEVLCTYVRQNCGPPAVPSEWPRAPGTMPQSLSEAAPPGLDVQAALTVIGRRPLARIAYERERGLALNFSGANLQHADLAGGDFSFANFKYAKLDGATLNGAQLRCADFWGASLHCAFLFDVQATSSCFASAQLHGATVVRSNLDNCLLLNAGLYQTSLVDSSLQGARLFGVQLDSAHFHDKQLDGSLGDATTKLPQGIARPATWLQRQLTPDESVKYAQYERLTPIRSRR